LIFAFTIAQPQAFSAGEPLFDSKKDGPLVTEPVKVMVQTTAGKLTFVLKPDWAPKTATQMAKLFRIHAFDGTEIGRYEPNFVMQIYQAETKAPGQMPMPLSLQKMIRRIPLEVDQELSGKLVHKEGALSMAHYDNDPASNTSSFSILLGNAPHLDKKYTIFGYLANDQDSQATINKIKAEWPKHPYVVKTISVSK
jgi:cyclophilin family peptidyl-prolyl cis-trans isomerase